MSFIEEVAEQVVDADKGEGIGQRGPFGGGDDNVEGVVDDGVDAEMGEKDGEELAADVEGEGIDAEDSEK